MIHVRESNEFHYFQPIESYWYGKGTERYSRTLEEDYPPQEKHYNNLRRGKTPSGKNINNYPKTRGREIIFTLPKGVSLVAMEDREVYNDFKHLVNGSLDVIENRFTFSRIDGEHINTANCIYAVFIEDKARPVGKQKPDTHLHAHTYWHPQTWFRGKWRAIDNRLLYENITALEMNYHRSLNYYLKKRGYETELIHNKYYDVAIDPDIRRINSKRLIQIEGNRITIARKYPGLVEAALQGSARAMSTYIRLSSFMSRGKKSRFHYSEDYDYDEDLDNIRRILRESAERQTVGWDGREHDRGWVK